MHISFSVTSKTRQKQDKDFFLLFLNQILVLSEVPKNPIPAKIHLQQTLAVFTLETDYPLDNSRQTDNTS